MLKNKNEFPKISIKMKNCKAFYRSKQQAALRKLFSLSPSPPSIPPDKMLLRLWNKNFFKEISRIIHTFAFTVFQECSSWASRNGGVNVFSDTKQKHACWKICKRRKVFGCVRFLEQNCIVK